MCAVSCGCCACLHVCVCVCVCFNFEALFVTYLAKLLLCSSLYSRPSPTFQYRYPLLFQKFALHWLLYKNPSYELFSLAGGNPKIFSFTKKRGK